MHEVLQELAAEGLLGVAVDGPRLVAEYSGFPRTLETFVSHAGEPRPLLLEVSPLGDGDPGRPWRDFEFVSPLLDGVETCAVVGRERDLAWLVQVAERLLPEAVVKAFDTREAAVAWLTS